MMSNVEHAWTVLCDRTAQDPESGNIALHVVEQLNVSLPKLLPGVSGFSLPFRVRLVSLWHQDRERAAKFRYRVRLLSPGGETFLESDQVAAFNKIRFRNTLSLDAIPIRDPGVYRFVIDVMRQNAWEQVAAVPLQIVDTSPARPPQIQPGSGARKITQKRKRQRRK